MESTKEATAALSKIAVHSPQGLTDTRKVVFFPLASAEHIVMASAAAVASSSSEELDSSMPVRSDTTVWKLSSDSSLPAYI